uniref:Uncharacterized protein n=1 Tax=Peronospora matthiolae TaxID=2874970 RepID=A0AAV1VJP5_9STRA
MDADAPVAAQISQADIIERQAESIARLKRQVKKAVEYKQLTKSKLKEAAARLKEYREHVETLREEGETLKKRLNDEKSSHENSKRLHQNALKQAVKAVKQKVHAATQTQELEYVTQASQTRLSGHVDQICKSSTVDSEVQTDAVPVDTLTSRKRTRGHAVFGAVHDEVDQLVPRLSRPFPEKAHHDVSTTEPMLALTAVNGATNLTETSAALDAELALSDSEDDSDEALAFEIENRQEDAAAQDSVLDLSVLDEIDMALEMITDEDREGCGATLEEKRSTKPLLGSVDPALLHEIDKELGSSSDDDDKGCVIDPVTTGELAENANSTLNSGVACLATGKQAHVSADVNALIADAIDKELATSSDEEDSVEEDSLLARSDLSAKPVERPNVISSNIYQNKETLRSIDEELDDEFAALDADSDKDSHEQSKGSSSSSGSSSNGDSSGSSSSESGGDGGDPITSTGHNAAECKFPDLVEKKEVETKVQRVKYDGKLEAHLSLPVDKGAVDVARPVGTEGASLLEDLNSTTIVMELPARALDPLQLGSSVELGEVGIKLGSSEAYQPGLEQKNDKDSIPSSGAITDGEKNNNVSIPSSGAITDGGDANAAVADTQVFKGQNALKRPTPLAPNTSTDGMTELEAGSISISEPISDLVPVEILSASTDSGGQAAETQITDNEPPKVSSVIECSAIRKVRKVDEANLESIQGTSQKKTKLDNTHQQAKRESGEALVSSTQILTGDGMSKIESADTDEVKDDQLARKKSLLYLERAVQLDEGKEPDYEFTRRTIYILVKQCSGFVNTCPDHVISLCLVLTRAYRKLGISPMLVVRASLSVFRTPRSRRLMQERKLSLSWLCNQVVLQVMCNNAEDLRQDGSIAPESLSLSLINECLFYLRNLLVEERTSVGQFLSDSSAQVRVAARPIKVSHEKVFLAHICALHTHLCRSSGQLVASRVLLFDLVRDNPNIRGLYFAMVTVEIYPAVLERKFDQHCVERQLILRETLQQALVYISGVAAAKQELLLYQPSTTMLHTIADAIQMPEIEEVDGSDPNLSRTSVENLFDKVSALCGASQSRLPDDKVQSYVAADYFALAKSIELCAAVYGLDLVTEIFSVDRCQALFNETCVRNKIGIMSIVGHVAMSFTSKLCNTQTSSAGIQQYVENVVQWMYHVLSTDEVSSPDDRFELMLGCAAVCIDLILGYPAPAGSESRRRVLCAVVHWFDTIPPEQSIGLPATFLRRLRLAVVAARPHITAK